MTEGLPAPPEPFARHDSPRRPEPGPHSRRASPAEAPRSVPRRLRSLHPRGVPGVLVGPPGARRTSRSPRRSETSSGPSSIGASPRRSTARRRARVTHRCGADSTVNPVVDVEAALPPCEGMKDGRGSPVQPARAIVNPDALGPRRNPSRTGSRSGGSEGRREAADPEGPTELLPPLRGPSPVGAPRRIGRTSTRPRDLRGAADEGHRRRPIPTPAGVTGGCPAAESPPAAATFGRSPAPPGSRRS